MNADEFKPLSEKKKITFVVNMPMNVVFTARSVFDKENDGNNTGWNRYIEWSKLHQLSEVVSLDSMLNSVLVKPINNSEEDWKYLVVSDGYQTDFYTSLDFVIDKLKGMETFNLLAIVKNPVENCKTFNIEHFEFIGYDLVDKTMDISALTNCGGFDETFLPQELNQYGLIEDFDRARAIWADLPVNSPNEHHTDTNMMAIWRHRQIGRKLRSLKSLG